MKATIIQPPYSLDLSKSDAYFQTKLDLLHQCPTDTDIIVLPEYSDVPCAANTWEETLYYHEKYIDTLLQTCRDTALRCDAVVFVNALHQTETGYRNTTYAIDRTGTVVGHYYKKHLPPSELYTLSLDSQYTRAQNRDTSEPYILTIDGIRYGFLTCYDFYFYEAYANIARQNVDILIGCSLQRSDTHQALEIMGRFVAYNCNAHLIRASVAMDDCPDLCGCSMVVTPKGDMLANLKSEPGMTTVAFDPTDKYYKPAGFGGSMAPHYAYIETGRNPWQYRPGGTAIVRNEEWMPYPRVCAHRGFSTIAPENSMPAFGAAVALGAEEIEFDLWYTRDGEIVSLHDDTLDRVSDGHGKIYEQDYADLIGLDFGVQHGEHFRGLRILRFEEILQKFACHVIMNIHIKPDTNSPYDPAIFQKMLDLIDRYDCRRYVYFMITNDQLLALAQQMAPDIPRVVGYDGHPEHMVERALRYGCKKIQLFKPYFDQQLMEDAHANGVLCNVFWSDDPEETKRLLDMGCDTILSNEYWAVAQAVEEWKKEHNR